MEGSAVDVGAPQAHLEGRGAAVVWEMQGARETLKVSVGLYEMLEAECIKTGTNGDTARRVRSAVCTREADEGGLQVVHETTTGCHRPGRHNPPVGQPP